VAGLNSRPVCLAALGLIVMTCTGVACERAPDAGHDPAAERAVAVCRDEVRHRLGYPDLAAFSTVVHLRRIGHHWFVRSAFEPERTLAERSFSCDVDDRGGRRPVHLHVRG